MRDRTSTGYSQKRMLQLKLNPMDIELITYLIQFFNSGRAKSITREEKIDQETYAVPYYYITYRKIREDLPWLYITSDRWLRELIYKYEKINLVKRYKPKPNSTLLYLTINQDILEEQQEFETMPGEDKTLAKYIKNKNINQKIVPQIRFCKFDYIYSNAGISMAQINLYGRDEFLQLLRTKLRQVVSPVCYDLLQLKAVDIINNEIHLDINCNLTTIKMNAFKIEEAIVTAYKQIID